MNEYQVASIKCWVESGKWKVPSGELRVTSIK